ncbi:hypothetical protein AGLY_001126 [Aphis glycines]|uniref:Uncharacterized protein n=1 Tax=Aphis glycines TaxID=307491 RepID=A0A6G0U9F8_APHGL|nr:hypothetical protein AGLY_001126 [Aphis glycines]
MSEHLTAVIANATRGCSKPTLHNTKNIGFLPQYISSLIQNANTMLDTIKINVIHPLRTANQLAISDANECNVFSEMLYKTFSTKQTTDPIEIQQNLIVRICLDKKDLKGPTTQNYKQLKVLPVKLLYKQFAILFSTSKISNKNDTKRDIRATTIKKFTQEFYKKTLFAKPIVHGIDELMSSTIGSSREGDGIGILLFLIQEVQVFAGILLLSFLNTKLISEEGGDFGSSSNLAWLNQQFTPE